MTSTSGSTQSSSAASLSSSLSLSTLLSSPTALLWGDGDPHRKKRRTTLLVIALLTVFVFVYFRQARDTHTIEDTLMRQRRVEEHLQPPIYQDMSPECPEFILGEDVSFERTGPRVLISTGAYNNVVDGVAKSLNKLVASMQQRGYQIIVVAPTGLKPAMQHYGVLYPAASMALPFRPEYSFALGLDKCTNEMLALFNPDIMHVASPDYLGRQMQAWAIKRGIPVVCSYHTRFNSYLPYYIGGQKQFLEQVDSVLWSWMRYFYNQCEHTYPPTPSVADELTSHGITQTQFRLWPRGIDLSMFNPQRRSLEMRATWDVAPDTIVILTVCRLVWEKNLELVVDAVKILEQHNVPHRAVVVGEGPARDKMIEMLPTAVYPGFLGGDYLSAAFASADIFFFPSLTETWGAVTLEAMASGLPVIVANAPGSKELVTDGVTGFLIDAQKPQRWANAITELVYNDELRTRIGKNAVKEVEKSGSLTWKHAMDMLEGHYRDILNPSKRYQEYFSVPPAEGDSGTD